MNEKKLILCDKLYDGIKDELQDKMEVLVEDKMITAVGRELPRDEYTEIIDLSELTVTPGMIDAHVHASMLKWQELEQVHLQSEHKS